MVSDLSRDKICIIYNPHAGRRHGGQALQQLHERWAGQADFRPTTHPGHADELAAQAVAEGYRVIAAAGGDGTAHEVANGLLSAGRSDVHFALLPLGSANDYAFSVAEEWPDPQSAFHRVDVGSVSAPGGRRRHFICCLGLGFNGAVTLEARKIRWLRGVPLYGLATLKALFRHFGSPPLQISIDDQPPVVMPTLMMSVLLGKREGSFVLAPNARLDDGWFDYIHSGALSRCEVLRLLPRLAFTGPPQGRAKILLGRCRRVHIRSQKPLITHIDGEFFCRPDDNVFELEIQLIPLSLSIQNLTPKASSDRQRRPNR